jgi:GT2 family glycosyltransferase
VQLLFYARPGIWEEINGALGSLERVSYPRDRWRLVIVNQPSDFADTSGYLREHWMSKSGRSLPEIRLVENDRNTGFAGGHQQALAAAEAYRPDFLYLLNADAAVEPDFLSTIVRQAQEYPRQAVIQSRLMLAAEPHLLNSRGNALHFLGFGYCLGYRQPFRGPERRAEGGFFYASGAGALIRLSALEKIGGLFDPQFFLYHEDVDLSWRARLAGYEIGYCEASVVAHRYEFLRSVEKMYFMERNRLFTLFSNYRVRTLLLLSPLLLLSELGVLVLALWNGWGGKKVQAWRFFFRPSVWRSLRRRRQMVRRLRKASDRHILESMSGRIEYQGRSSLLCSLANPLLERCLRLLKGVVWW